ncbi:MAG: DNA (cytosine-5-)-methyltransferase [Gammaproteobacteria bacterium]|nr:DNA (cytosine-5-)-methyltransferase [Gammaproteobacteria bacterium]
MRASVSFPKPVYAGLAQIASARNVSVAWVVRDAAENYVAESIGPAATEQLGLALTPKRRQRRTLAAGQLAGSTHRVAGLFAGIGGIELGLQRAGHHAALLCENDRAAQAVLRERFPGVPYHVDVTNLRRLPEGTSIVTAGFPCQDLSQAGETKGIGGLRSGLVAEVFRLVKSSAVPWILLENVPFMLQLGRGEAMNVITSALEALGYRWAYRVVDSRAFGLPQRRRRVYLLASNVGDPRSVLFADETDDVPEKERDRTDVACGFYWTEGLRGLGWAVDAVPTLKGGSTIGIPSPPAVLMPDGRIVTPHIEDAERLQGFPAGWTRPAEQCAKPSLRWKLVGNAVSVPAAVWIGRRLKKPGECQKYNVRPIGSHRNWPTAAWNVGQGRFRVEASEFPVRTNGRPLTEIIARRATDLSPRATAGFLSRAEKASLRFPSHFIPAVRAHLERVSSEPRHGRTRSEKVRKAHTKSHSR